MLNAKDYIGRMIGDRYLIKKEIGHGASSMVFFAEDRMKGIHVAIKVMDRDDNEYQLNDNSFRTEIRALMEISSHANIVEIYDACFDGDEHYIVMEHVEGCTLRRYLDQNGILPEKTTVELARQMLRALEHAHKAHIVHRDVKPQNIMILTDKQGNLHIKLADFGIACLPDKDLLAMKDRGIGTLHYISPEQAAGYQVDARSDLYSLGIVLYEMVTGHIPFEANSATAVLAKHQTDVPKPPRCYNPELNPQLGAIVMKALEKDPHARFKSADAMLKALDDMCEGRGTPTTVHHRTPTPTAPKKGQYKPPRTARVKQPRVARERMPLSDGTKKAIFGGIGGIAAVALIVCFIVFLVPLFGKQSVDVPNFVGLMYQENAAWPDNITIGNITYQHDKETAGTIIKQTPNGGMTINDTKNVTVDLIVSKGPEMATINLTEEQRKDADAAFAAIKDVVRYVVLDGSYVVLDASEADESKPSGYVLYAKLSVLDEEKISLTGGQIRNDGEVVHLVLYTNP